MNGVADAYLHNDLPTKMRCTIVQREHKKMGLGGKKRSLN